MLRCVFPRASGWVWVTARYAEHNQNGLANCLKSGNRGTVVVAFHEYFRGRSVPVVLAVMAIRCHG